MTNDGKDSPYPAFYTTGGLLSPAAGTAKLCVGGIAAIAALILLVIYFVTLFGLKSQVQAGFAQPKYGAPM
jgi:hypothetical protein